MRYRVRWLDEQAWTVHERSVQAASAELAVASHSAPGLRLLGVQRSGPGWRNVFAPAAPRLDVAWWCRELRVLLGAGMTVVEAVQTLRMQAPAGARASLLDALHAALLEGRSFSAAMAATGAFPVVLLAGVVASERTGALVDALDEYLRYHEQMDQLRKKLVSAAMYPLLVSAVGCVVVLFLLWFVVPRFAAAYAEARGAVSGATQLLLLASSLLRDHARALAVLFSLALVALAGAWRLGWLRAGAARAVDALGPLRSVADEFKRAKLFHALALMFRGGYPLPECLERCAAIGLGGRWAANVAEAQVALQRGQGPAQAFAAHGLCDAVDERLLGVGERTGSFVQVLQTIAERHAGRFATVVERVTRLAEPLLLLLVAAGIGAVVVLMYLPIFDLAGSLR